MTTILGIETSCDDTGIGVVQDGCRILVNDVSSQIDVHAAFGGVVPEIFSGCRHDSGTVEGVDLFCERDVLPDLGLSGHGCGFTGLFFLQSIHPTIL